MTREDGEDAITDEIKKNGNTASFTVVYGGIISSVKPICDNVSPSIHLTAYLTKGSPIDHLF